jgi:hypothetical protein
MNREKIIAIILVLSLSANVYLLFADHDILDHQVQRIVNQAMSPPLVEVNNTSLLNESQNNPSNQTVPTPTPINELLNGKPDETVPLTVAETAEPTPPSDGWTTYTNTKYKFSLRYPLTWAINEQPAGSPATLLILTAPIETDCDTIRAQCFKYIATLTIGIDQDPEMMDLEEYFNHAVAALQKDYGITSTSRSASCILSGNRAYQIEFYTRDERGNPDRSYMQYYTIIDKKGYIISYTGPYSTVENVYSHNKGDAQRIIDSFNLERVYEPV